METKEQKSFGQKIKFGVIASSLVVIGLVSGYVLGVYGYVKIIGPYLSEIKYKKFLEDYLKPYKEDFTGGNTPEETIDLFIAALKKGDYGLASRYFVVEEQEVWRKKLQGLTKEQLDNWIGKIEENKKIWRKEQQGENQFVIKYNTGEGESEKTHFIVLEKNVNNKWKIGSF